MKPGSSYRCKSRALIPKFGRWYRCHRHIGHDGDHQAPQRSLTLLWREAVSS